MNQTLPSSPTPSLPVARFYRLKELPGWLGKWLEVPPGFQGIVVDAHGKVRLLPPGRHQILDALGRIRGNGAGLRAGLLPAQPLTAWCKVQNLLSGDRELLDASLLCAVEITDAGRFFLEQVIPNQTLSSTSLDLGDAGVIAALDDLTRQYAAEDLISGLPTARLLPELRLRLGPVLANRGLQLIAIQIASFRKAAERAEVAARVLALQERLDNIELSRKMAELETQTQLNDFIHQLDPTLQTTAGLRLASEPAREAAIEAQKETPPRSSPFDLVRSWFAVETRQDNKGRHWRLTSLFDRQPKPEEEKTVAPRLLKRWMTQRGMWLLITLSLATLLSLIILWVGRSSSSDFKWDALYIVWIPVLGFLCESVVALFKKREEVAELFWARRGATYLDDLTHNNRKRADRLVRDQCGSDMLHIRDMLNDVRARVYRAGDVDLALRIKQLEQKFEAAHVEVQNLGTGQSPYLTDLNIKTSLWEKMLDYDEHLLVRTAALAEDAHLIQQTFGQGQPIAELLNQLEGRLDAFGHRFETRGQALKTSEQDQQKYR